MHAKQIKMDRWRIEAKINESIKDVRYGLFNILRITHANILLFYTRFSLYSVCK